MGKGEATGAVGTPIEHDERRLWVRYHADFAAKLQVSQTEAVERVPVRVQNISIGGASLIADRELPAGQMVSLECPVGDDLQVVLACVVRVTPMGDGQWSLGCAFSRELSRADLEHFGARGTQPPSDQRSWVRHECSLQAAYQPIGEGEVPPRTVQVLNVSASGVGLLLDHRVDAGSLLNLHLHNKHGKPVRTILACVVHSTQRANGELVAGCNFIRELGEDELAALL
jgi:hypothetical protein